MKSSIFLTPSKILYGEGSLADLETKVESFGSKALLVTDSTMSEVGYADKVASVLKSAGVDYVIYDEVDQEPTDNLVYKGLELYQQNGCDFLVSLGGGSPLDAAKAIGVLVTNEGEITDFKGQNKVSKELPPHISIPTTAGTGSEVTKVTIIADTKNDVKMLIGSPRIVPDMAVVDSELTMSVPAKFTAATGVDALTHAIEAYTSKLNQPLTDNLSISAIKRISKYLRRAWANGDDREARNELHLAATEAGLAFSNSSVTIVHGMSRPIGALFHVPHGISNAVLLPACMEFAVMGAPERFAEVAEAMGVENAGDDLECAYAGVEAVKKLCAEVEIPTISELGIDDKEFMKYAEKMANDAIDSGSPGNTYRKPTVEDIVGLYKKAL